MPATSPFPPRWTIRIRKHAFTFPTRYQPGHQLTQGEAQALNGLLAENVRNNLDQEVIGEIEKLDPGEFILSVEAHKELQQRIEAYAKKYQFQFRSETKVRKGPLELEIEDLAAQAADQAAQAAGEEPGETTWQQEFNRASSSAEIHQEAKQRLEQKRLAAAAALGELLG